MNLIERLRSRYVWPVIIVWLIYCVLSLLNPQNVVYIDRYHISMLTANLLLITTYFPYLIIWLFAVAGCRHLVEATRLGRHKVKKNSYYMLTAGLAVLTTYLFVLPLIGATYAFLGGDKTNPTWAISIDFLGIFSILAGFALMYIGSIRLLRFAKQSVPLLTKILNAGMPTILFTIFYTSIAIHTPATVSPANTTPPAISFLPDFMVVTAVIFPLMVTWALGLLLVLNMERYSHYTEPRFRKSYVYLYDGLLVIVAAAILSQAIDVLGSERLAGFNLAGVLAIHYSLLGLIILGFALISKGAKLLKIQLSDIRNQRPVLS